MMKIKKLALILLLGLLAFIIFWLFSPDLSFQYLENLADTRVNRALNMYDGSQLVYSIRSTRNGYGTAKIFVYWTDASFEEVVQHNFIREPREHSRPDFRALPVRGNGYYGRVYYLSDLPQDEMDNILYFAHDLCCYAEDPARITMLSFYIFSADTGNRDTLGELYFGYGDGMLNADDIGHQDGDGTYIVYGYRAAPASFIEPIK